MKKIKKKLSILYIMFFMVSGCEKQNTVSEVVSENTEEVSYYEENTPSEYLPQTSAGVCLSATSFLEGVSKSLLGFYSYDSIFIIKGIVSDKYEYGLNIRLVEDLKGNFPENVDTFIVWGGGNTFLESHTLDYLEMYDEQDVLIMLLTPVRDIPAEMIPPGNIWEKLGDYTTLNCTHSVLKLSDDYLTGRKILTTYVEEKMWHNISCEEKTSFYENHVHISHLDYISHEELQLFLEQFYNNTYATSTINTMPWEDFQKKLNELFNQIKG